MKECEKCNGTGETIEKDEGFHFELIAMECDECEGTGTAPNEVE